MFALCKLSAKDFCVAFSEHPVVQGAEQSGCGLPLPIAFCLDGDRLLAEQPRPLGFWLARVRASDDICCVLCDAIAEDGTQSQHNMWPSANDLSVPSTTNLCPAFFKIFERSGDDLGYSGILLWRWSAKRTATQCIIFIVCAHPRHGHGR